MAEKLGFPDPFELASILPRKTFIWWRVRNRLKLSEFHEKWEYYFAQLRLDIKSLFSDEVHQISEGLIKLKQITEEEDEIRQERADRDFMGFMIGEAERRKRMNKNG